MELGVGVFLPFQKRRPLCQVGGPVLTNKSVHYTFGGTRVGKRDVRSSLVTQGTIALEIISRPTKDP